MKIQIEIQAIDSAEGFIYKKAEKHRYIWVSRIPCLGEFIDLDGDRFRVRDVIHINTDLSEEEMFKPSARIII